MNHTTRLFLHAVAYGALACSTAALTGCETAEILQRRMGSTEPAPAGAVSPVSDQELRQKSAAAIGDGLTAAFVAIDNIEKGSGLGYANDRYIRFDASDLRNGRVYGMNASYPYKGQEGDYSVRLVSEKPDHVLTPEQLERKQELSGTK